MRIIWLGQGGFMLESNGQRLCIDPYISDMVERKEGLTRISAWIPDLNAIHADYYFCTHCHMDHFDSEAMPQVFAEYKQSVLAGPQSVVDKCRELGLEMDRVSLAVSEFTLGCFTLKLTPAYHSDKAAVGAIVECNGKRIYISGDSEYRESLASDVAEASGGTIDAAFICINGRLGNMNYQDAAKVIKELGPRRVYPMHYGMFAENTVNPEPFVELFSSSAIICSLMTEGVGFDI